jgi:hypothetical protein
LLEALVNIAYAIKLPITAMNVDEPASSDSESFARYHIPRITFHSLTQQTAPILHSSRDKIDAVKLDDYYVSYRLIAAYLSYLDTYLDAPPPAKKPAQ